MKILACLALVTAAAGDADACKTPPPCEVLAATPLADGLEGKLAAADGRVAARAAVSLATSGSCQLAGISVGIIPT